MNLTILSDYVFFTHTQPHGPVLKSIAVGLSTGFAFLQFCGTALHSVIALWCCKQLIPKTQEKPNNRIVHREKLVVGDAFSARGYRDSIFNESEPFLPTY